MSYIDPVAPATPDTWGVPGTAKKSGTELDKDTFMKLLVAQLKYQDPLSPADPQQFLAQTAQFTSVEKLEQIAKQSSEQTWAMALNTAGSLVGKQVTFLRMDGTTGTGLAASATTDPDGIVLNVGDEQVPLGAITNIAPHTAAQGTTDAVPAAKATPTTTPDNGTDADAGSSTETPAPEGAIQ